MKMSEFRQDRLSAARVMVVGCGALGNEVLKNLALAGVGHLVVVDFDVVETDNLAHSVLFSSDDALTNRPKVDAVAERLKTMNPSIEIEPINGDIAYDIGLGLLRTMDMVVGCVDNRWARYCINRLCMRAGIPWVDGGIDGLEGTARVFMPGDNCYACSLGPEGLRDLAYRMPCSGSIRRNQLAGKVPTTSITASVVGAIQAQECLKLLHPEALAERRFTSLAGRMFCYEGEHLTTRTVAFKAFDADCPVHEKWEPIVMSPLTSASRVDEALAWLRGYTDENEVTLQLVDDCFVDFVEQRTDGSTFPVMKPGRAVADFVDSDARLAGLLLSGLYQHELREITETFPYQHLPLSALGIADRAVFPVEAGGRELYIELSKA